MELLLKQIGWELESESIKKRVEYTINDVTCALVELRKVNNEFVDRVNSGEVGSVSHLEEAKNSYYWYVTGLLRTLEYFLPCLFSFEVIYGNVFLRCNDRVIWSEK